MNVLAFDTCFGACSVAVRLSRPANSSDCGADTFETFAKYEEMATGHAERLIPMIDEVMERAGVTFSDLDVIAVTEGPGTFTGLRVGVAAARALALASGLPIRAASSLSVMAQRAFREMGQMVPDEAITVSVDARNNQVYAQAFSAHLDALTPPMILSPEEAAELVPSGRFIAVGSGAQGVAEAAARLGLPAQARLPGVLPDARDLAAMASSLPVRTPLTPVYLRAPDAKPQTGKSLPRA